MAEQAVQVQDQIETLKAKERELRQAQAALKLAQKDREWEAKTKAKNPQYVVGSLRKASAEEVAALGHCHGVVCDIVCAGCGTVRTVNKQDAFQAQFCKACGKEARKAVAKEKRAEKRLEGLSVSDIEAQIAELNNQLAKMA